MLDTARADALEPYGAPAGASPVVADLARRGAALPAMHATACWTLPSHASMFSGRLPRGLGVTQAPAQTPQSARPVLEGLREHLLPEVLRRAGYSTAAVSTNLWVSALSGFDVGFDEFVQVDTARQSELALPGLRRRVRWAAEALRARVDDGAEEAEGVIRGWLDALPDDGGRAPFFWFVNLVDCHSPYLPPHPYNGLGPLDRVRAADDARRYFRLGEIIHVCIGGAEVPSDALERMRRLYAGAVRLLDDWLGRVLDALERRGVLDDTLVLVTSDHGENLGEAGLIAHGLSLDQRLIRVPFVAAGPGRPRADGPTSLADLPRLVADAVGLTDHPWRAEALPAGFATAQWDPYAGPEDPRNHRAIAEWGLGDEALHRLTTPLTAATDGRFKLVRDDDGDRFYDLHADSLELAPRPGEAVPREVGMRLRAALDHPAVRARRTVAPGEADPDEIAEIEERMRLLGYM